MRTLHLAPLLALSLTACFEAADPLDDEALAAEELKLDAPLPAGIASVRMSGTEPTGAITAYDTAGAIVTRASQTAATRTTRSVTIFGGLATSLQAGVSRTVDGAGTITLAGGVNGQLYKIVKPLGGATVMVRPTYTSAERSLLATWSALDSYLVGLAPLRPCTVQGVRTVTLSQACLAGNSAVCTRAFDAATAAASGCP